MISRGSFDRCAVGERGFTLIELLVAFTLLALLALVMTSGLRIGAVAWRRAENASDHAETVAAVRRLLRFQLNAIYPLWQENDAGQGAVLFTGESDRLAYIAPPPSQLSPGPDQAYELELANGDLRFSWGAIGNADTGARKQAVLLHDVRSLDLAYYGPPRASNLASWSESWAGRARLPELIRIRVTFPPGDQRLWPDLVVSPAIAADVTCIYDPIGLGCRGRPQW